MGVPPWSPPSRGKKHGVWAAPPPAPLWLLLPQRSGMGCGWPQPSREAGGEIKGSRATVSGSVGSVPVNGCLKAGRGCDKTEGHRIWGGAFGTPQKLSLAPPHPPLWGRQQEGEKERGAGGIWGWGPGAGPASSPLGWAGPPCTRRWGQVECGWGSRPARPHCHHGPSQVDCGPLPAP